MVRQPIRATPKFKDKEYIMESIEEMRTQLSELHNQMKKYRDTENLSNEEIRKVNNLCDEVEEVNAKIALQESREGPAHDPYRQYGKAGDQYRPRQGYTSYRDLFGDSLSNDGFKSFAEFARAAAGGSDSRLRLGSQEAAITVVGSKRSMEETVPSTGGFMVPTEFSAALLDIGVEDSIVLKRAQVWPMQSSTLKIPGWEIGSHVDNIYGGIICSWEAESATLTETNPKTRMIELNAHKLTAYCTSSNELKMDAPDFEARLSGAIAKAIGWYLDRSMIASGSAGSGAGRCQSFLTSPALITVTKESGQRTGTILHKNIINIIARMWPPGFMRSVWIANIDAIPALMELTVPVGTGGAHVKVMSENSGQFTIYGRPVLFTEKAPSFSSAGGLSLVDLSQYAVGLRGQLQVALSGHLLFQSDRTAWRAIWRADAQGTWNEALTPESGSTLSPFITLGAR